MEPELRIVVGFLESWFNPRLWAIEGVDVVADAFVVEDGIDTGVSDGKVIHLYTRRIDEKIIRLVEETPNHGDEEEESTSY